MKHKDHELNFRLVFETAPESMIITDNEGCIINMNDITEHLLEYSKEELTGQPLALIFPDNQEDSLAKELINYFKNPVPRMIGRDQEVILSKKSGVKIPAEIRMSPLATNGNIFVLVTLTSISDQLKATKQLELIIESALNAMVLTNSSGRIVMINKQTELLFGYQREELIGKKVEILVPQRMKNQHPDHRKKFYAHPKARPMGAGRDLFGVKKDGTEIPVEIGLNPIEKDGVQYVLASVIDITERKKTEEAIRLYARQIEEKNKELEEFAHVASHDLREPLNSIISLTELLLDRKSDQLDEDGVKMLNYISQSSFRMSELIIGLLEYAQLGNSKELIMVDLNELLGNILLDLNSSVRNSNATLHVGHMPVIKVYAMEFRQLFQNLISNALKYNTPGIPPEIWISAIQQNKGWEFTVSDNGIGIPEGQEEKIFNLFHRLHRNNEYEGTGIGLAHSRKIAELHNGKIWVESEAGKGSTFHVFIPSKIT